MENKINLHLLICFISYLLLNYLRLKIEGLDMSLKKAIDELRSIYGVEFED